MKQTFKFYRTLIDGETVTIEADSLTEAVEILDSGDWEGSTEPLESWGWQDVDIMNGREVASTVPFPGSPEKLSYRFRCIEACHGLDLPADCPPGILADLVTVSRGLLVLAESPRIGQGNIPSGWPDKAREILAKLAPAGSPDNGKPVSPPEPEEPRLPEVVERAIRHAQTVDPSIDRMTFWEEQWWQFGDAGCDSPAFPPGMDLQPFEDALDYVYENGGFPQAFQLVNTMAPDPLPVSPPEPVESGVRYPEGQPSGHGHTPLEHRIANY